jgi:ABC-2 type transport system ATP-binding protein
VCLVWPALEIVRVPDMLCAARAVASALAIEVSEGVGIDGRNGNGDDAAGGYAVETCGLTKRFGDRTAVDRVNLLVPQGTAFGYLGPNGAGKTTLIRMLLGLTRATGGSMRLLGHPVPAERSIALTAR